MKSDGPEEDSRSAPAREADRERAIAVARFLDEKYPNDNATDAARHQLASLLTEDKRSSRRSTRCSKVRPAYAQITNVRLLEGYLATQLVAREARRWKLPTRRRPRCSAGRSPTWRRRAKPVSVALEAEVRGYISARCRLAMLMFAQGRVDPAAEKANPGYNQALTDRRRGARPPSRPSTAWSRTEGGAKKPNLDGLEMMMLAQDVHAARHVPPRPR